MKSEYERQREANIASNQAVLQALGLAGNNALKPKAVAAQRERATVFVPEEERRRSSRVSKQVVTFQSLSHEFCDDEERLAEASETPRDGSLRKRSAARFFREEQELEAELQAQKRDLKASQRRQQLEQAKKAQLAVAMQQRAPQQAVLVRAVVQPRAVVSAAVLPAVGPSPSRKQFKYKTLHDRTRCPSCKAWFCVTDKGLIRKHWNTTTGSICEGE